MTQPADNALPAASRDPEGGSASPGPAADDRSAACPDDERLGAFLFGSLPEIERRVVELHIDGCTDCRETLADLARHSFRSGLSSEPESPQSGNAPSGGSTKADAGESAPAAGRLGRYVLGSVLGAGGMGVVFQAHDPDIGRRVAIKLIRRLAAPERSSAELMQRLVREARAMAQVCHPNVLPIHDAGIQDGQLFIVMQHVEGLTLRQWLAESRRGREEILDVFLHAGEGLRAVHEAGLIHGDFKPDIVIGAGGAVWLIDFGLARIIGEAAQPASALGSKAEDGPGRRYLAGTPAYLAPELLAGGAATTQSDQYSFCVALYEALFDRRPPHPPRTPAAAARADRRRYFDGLRRVLARGLAADPAERFPDLKQLLRALQVRTRRARIRRLALLAGLGAALLLVGAGLHLNRSRSLLCRGAEEKWRGIWDEPRRRDVMAVLGGSSRPYAAATARSVAESIDRYVHEWVGTHRDACLATARREQSEGLLDLRMGCLEQRRQEARARIDVLAAGPLGDNELLDRAVAAVQHLRELGRCSDAAALREEAPPRIRPELAARTAVLQARLDDVQAQLEFGRSKEAVAKLHPLLPEADALQPGPYRARARYLLGRIERETGDVKAAEKDLEEAVWDALSSRQDDLAVQALVQLGGVADDLVDIQKELILLERARGLLRRSVREPRLVCELESRIAVALSWVGRAKEAEEGIEYAVDIAEKSIGLKSLQGARVLTDRARVRTNTGHLGAATADFRRALEIVEPMLGSAHRVTRDRRSLLTVSLFNLGRYQEALVQGKRVISDGEAILGADHPSFIIALHLLSAIQSELGQPREAEQSARRALDLVQRHRPLDHIDRSDSLCRLGDALRGQERFAEAEEALRRCVEIVEALKDPNTQFISNALELQSQLLADMKKPEALDVLLRAMALREKAHQGAVVDQSNLLIRISALYKRRGDEASAKQYRERAAGALAREEKSPRWARYAFAVARTLEADDPRACALSREAQSLLRGQGEPDDEVAEWVGRTCRTPS